ncbi:V-type proton ATPase subunit e-like [Cimex lectularius]|uniref:V-type proton ATPase subunit n=1 Tax=Cimex lectularius TaxID=79782 RepID=A0A8I6RTK0_CIMLE|nr:V-type proton ATPase subunit e-like [Cimex lectularius]
MGLSVIPFSAVTGFWAIFGIILPFLVPRSDYVGLVRMSLALTAFCCWLFWLCVYLGQMNPLIGPKLTNTTLIVMAQYWGNRIPELANS